MLVEAPVLGRQRRLDQMIRKFLHRDRVVMLDPARADLVAVAIEELHREFALLQPVLVRGLVEGRQRQRQRQHQTDRAHGRGLGGGFHQRPALPAADMEPVHEGDEALVQFARPARRLEQPGIDPGVQIEEKPPYRLAKSGFLSLSHAGVLVLKHWRFGKCP